MNEKTVAQASWPVPDCAGWQAGATISATDRHVLVTTTRYEDASEKAFYDSMPSRAGTPA